MATDEVTGRTEEGLKEKREEFKGTSIHEDGIPFETTFCLYSIHRQPDDYDGPQRYCTNRVVRLDWASPKYEESFGACCPKHGGDLAKVGREHADNVTDDPTDAIKHGMYSEDENLMMDFTDSEQELYDSIMEKWPEIYDWPPKDEDPARYRILRRVAVNEIRSMRAEDYLDEEGEVYEEPVYDEQGVEIGSKDTENPLSREYRLLMSEITSQMKELGLTPKERQKMDTLSSEADKNDAFEEAARDALSGDDEEFDPAQFDES